MHISLNNLMRMAAALSVGLAMFAISTTSATAATVTIDFDGITGHVSGFVDVPSGYTEDAFTLTSNNIAGFGSIGLGSSAFAGSQSLFNKTQNDTTTLKQIDNLAFDIFSIQLSENDLGIKVPFSVVFLGTKAVGGATDTVAFSLNGTFGNFGDQIFTFTSFFRNLVSVSWTQGPPNYQFDNIVVESIAVIPLPAALPLYGTGLAVMGLIGWRRKQKAAAQA